MGTRGHRRTIDALALKARGVILGAEALGWRCTPDRDGGGRRLIVQDPDEDKTIRRILALHEAGFTLRSIAADLKLEGVAGNAGVAGSPLRSGAF